MAKKNLTTTDRSGKSLSSTSTPLSTTTIDKSGKITPNTELSEEERKEKFGEFFFCFLFCLFSTCEDQILRIGAVLSLLHHF